MKKFTLLAPLTAGVIILTGCANVRTIGEVNGVTLTSVRQRGVFSPSKTTLLGSTSAKTNEVDVLSDASGPGLIPAIATAGGIVGGAALLRPARTSVEQSSEGNISVSSTSASGRNTPQSPPPGHINNPSGNH